MRQAVNRMTIKKIASKLHLWLGMTMGLVLVVNLVPAALFVFEKELSSWWYHDELFTRQIAERSLPLSVLRQNAQASLPKKDIITGMQVQRDPDRTYAFTVFRAAKDPGFTVFSEYEAYKQVYVNPYNGKVQGIVDMQTNWIYLCRMMHQQMLLRYDIGHLFIAICSLILIVSLITGLILWFPKNKAALKQRFSIKWEAKWRRKNYDIHNVGGFYTYLLILLLLSTGLIWSFGWWAKGFYKVLGDDFDTMNGQYEQVSALPVQAQNDSNPLDLAFENMLTRRKNWTEMYVGFPAATGKDLLIGCYLTFNDHNGWEEGDEYQYDGYTGLLVKQVLFEKKSVALKWQNSNYAIHTGSIYGWPTKILMCLGTLFCASLPITGFMIWYGRNYKKKKKAKGK